MPEIPPTEFVSRLGEEILDYHAPDEDLKVEDVLADLDVTTPEEVAETHELHLRLPVAPTRRPRPAVL